MKANLAHGYLFAGDYDKAEDIYLENKNTRLSDSRSFSEHVLDDFRQFRSGLESSRHGSGRAPLAGAGGAIASCRTVSVDTAPAPSRRLKGAPSRSVPRPNFFGRTNLTYW
jgi:hypothetical protein